MTEAWDSWEDYRAGLYLPDNNLTSQERARRLLADQGQFFEAAREMLREWPQAAIQNLDHMWSGRRAWVGQATCCYSLGATAADTRVAWGLLTNAEQRAANRIADSVIDLWRKDQSDAQTLFGH